MANSDDSVPSGENAVNAEENKPSQLSTIHEGKEEIPTVVLHESSPVHSEAHEVPADGEVTSKDEEKKAEESNVPNGHANTHQENEDDRLSYGESLIEGNLLAEGDFHSTYSVNDGDDLLNGDVIADHLPVSPDGGYGWVIVIAAFISNFIVDGISNSFGPFMASYQETFKASKAATSFIGSLLIGSYLLSGPIAGGLLNKYEARYVVIGGTLLASVSFALSTFSPNIFVHYMLYGLFGGIGFGFIYLPAIVVVSQYFESKRALATGIAVAGSGFGTFVMPIVCKLSIESYGWKFALYIVAALILVCALCGRLYKPLPVPDFNLEEHIKAQEEMKQQALLAALSRADAKSDDVSNDGTASGPGSPTKRSTIRTTSQCTGAEKEDGQPLLQNEASTGARTISESATDDNIATDTATPSSPARQQLSPIIESRALNKSRTSSQHHHHNAGPPPSRSRKFTMTSVTSEFTTAGDFKASRPNLASQLSRVSARSYAQSLSRISQAGFSLKAGDSLMSVAMSGVDPKEFARPLSRRDIFLQGSIKNLREFTDEGSNFRNYRESQISIPATVVAQSVSAMSQAGGDFVDQSSRLGGSRYSRITGGLLGDEEDLGFYDDSQCKWIPSPIRNAFNEMIDLNLLREPVMLLLCLSNILGMLGFYVPFVFIIDLAIARNASASEATFLLSLIGITNTFGRVFFGWAADRRWVSALAINNWSLISCGLLTCICPLLPSYAWLSLYSALFGFIVSAYVCLTSIVLSDLLGVERLTNSFGLLVVSRGIASLMGTPLAGIVYDMTQSYDASFFFAGSLVLLSGIVSCVIPFAHRYERSKMKNEGDYPLPKDIDAQSGKLSVLTERSEENLTEYQRTVQSLKQQRALIRELDEYKRSQITDQKVEEVNEENAVDGKVGNGTAAN